MYSVHTTNISFYKFEYFGRTNRFACSFENSNNFEMNGHDLETELNLKKLVNLNIFSFGLPIHSKFHDHRQT